MMFRDSFRVPPWPIYRFGVWLLSSLHVAKRALEPPPTTIFDMVRGSWRSQVCFHIMEVGGCNILERETDHAQPT